MRLKISAKNRQRQHLLLIKSAEDRIRSSELLLKKDLYKDAVSRAHYAFFDTANKEFLNFVKKEFSEK